MYSPLLRNDRLYTHLARHRHTGFGQVHIALIRKAKTSSRHERNALSFNSFHFCLSVARFRQQEGSFLDQNFSIERHPAMKCFHFSNTEKKEGGRSFKNRFTWHFFSQSSPAPALPAKQPSSSSLTQSHAVSEPVAAGASELSSLTLPHSSSQRPPDPRVFTFAELRAATKNFAHANLLGEGGFGCVFKGLLKSRDSNEEDKDIAVKRLNLKGKQGHKEWLAEVRYLGAVEHPNLVKLVGYCTEDDERGIQRLLVYEYMPNRSLEDQLFQTTLPVLSWQRRLSLMLGAARGLAYLHEEISDMQVIFRDFKASNVLIDSNFTSRLSDFGLARQGPEMGATHVSTMVVGTMGYAAPEYVHTGHLTSKSDVWSFGVVLLEILSGRRALDRNRPKPEQHLIDWVKPYVNSQKKIHRIMDPRLESEYSVLQAHRVASLASQCLGKHPRTRPLMSAVTKSLMEIIALVDDADLHNHEKSTMPAQTTENMVYTKALDAANPKKRKLLNKDAMSLKSKEGEQKVWKVWTPKPIST